MSDWLYKERPFPSCWVLPHIPHHERKRPCFLPCHGPVPGCKPSREPGRPGRAARGRAGPGVFAAAVARYRALDRLRGFRQSLYECLNARADALFELADAVLCADHAVTSLVQLCLEPEFTRGHGALYDALSAGRIDDERFFSLLASELPQAVDGPEAPAWIAEHDVIDHGLLEKALAGLPPDDAAQVRDACARWARLRFAVDATAYPRPDAWCSPGREHVHNGACHCRGSSKTAPGWEYQFTAAIGHLRTAWAALTDVARTTPATRTAADDRAGEERAAPPARRRARRGRPRRCSSSTPATAPPPSPTGSSAARSTSWSGSPPAACSTPIPSPGRAGTAVPPAAGPRCTAWSPRTSPRTPGTGRGAGRSPCPRTPNPTRSSPCPIPRSTAPSAPRPGTASTPSSTATAAGSPAGRNLPVLRGTLVHVTVERLPDGRDPHRAMWLWHAGPGPLSLDELWRAYLATLRHRARLQAPQGHPRPHRRESPRPRPGRPLGPAPHGRARPAPARPAPGRRPPPALGETARSRPAAAPRPGPPRISQHPPPPRDTRPCRETLPARARPAQRQQQRPSSRPATCSPAKPTCRAQQTRR